MAFIAILLLSLQSETVMNKKLMSLLIVSFIYAPIYAERIVAEKLGNDAFVRYFLGKSQKFGLCAEKAGVFHKVYLVNGKYVVGSKDDADKFPYSEKEHGSFVWKTDSGAKIELTYSDWDVISPFRVAGIKVPRVASWWTAALVAVIALENVIRWKRSEKDQDQKKKHRSKHHIAAQ